MVEQLGPARMSSDESEVDKKTKKTTYRIRKCLWRSSECKDRLLIIDADRNVTSGALWRGVSYVGFIVVGRLSDQERDCKVVLQI